MFGSISRMTINMIPKRHAGHSKWANIKHVKAAKDGQKSLLFMNLGRRIKFAILEGGSPNPDLNIKLHQAVEVAKKQSMPNSTIQNYIKSAENDKSASKMVSYEVKGPGGCFVIISALTDNSKRTKSTIAAILKKFRASFSERAANQIFENKGEIIAFPPSDLEKTEEQVVNHAIECGAEEVVPDENEEGAFKFTCEVNELNKVTTKLQTQKYTIKSSDFNFVPRIKVQLSDEDIETMSKLMDKLEEHPDVVNLYDNIA